MATNKCQRLRRRHAKVFLLVATLLPSVTSFASVWSPRKAVRPLRAAEPNPQDPDNSEPLGDAEPLEDARKSFTDALDRTFEAPAAPPLEEIDEEPAPPLEEIEDDDSPPSSSPSDSVRLESFLDALDTPIEVEALAEKPKLSLYSSGSDAFFDSLEEEAEEEAEEETTTEERRVDALLAAVNPLLDEEVAEVVAETTSSSEDKLLSAMNANEVDEEEDDTPVAALSEEEQALAQLLGQEAEYRDAGMFEDERLGRQLSHELVKVDEDGDPLTDRDRMVFVDEATCIGCTNCACVAPQTFTMDPDHGRARAVRQDGDTEDTIAEAIATCPVDCIHWVPWDELVDLEKQRDAAMGGYNFKARLVGNEGLLSMNAGSVLLDISSNKALRCSNCPTNKCPDCPMFGVGDDAARENLQKNGAVRKRCGSCPSNGCIGCPVAAENPEFQKRRSRREAKRRQRRKAEQDTIKKEAGLLDANTPVDL